MTALTDADRETLSNLAADIQAITPNWFTADGTSLKLPEGFTGFTTEAGSLMSAFIAACSPTVIQALLATSIMDGEPSC